ncbi:MAG: hypothetical protein DRG82_03960 [Deltaproteobacteria bacterium]|nr:MAG: hypothetical protein B1H13_10355 [Desulfobacteraceae bacterium 4484_190.3]RLB18400.1 MAG: hypothetical protein DRG82_03960 [Deltaproteobacteria bacterium]
MARIDDYRTAVELGKKELEGKNPKRIADQCGATFGVTVDGSPELLLSFLNREVLISGPNWDVSFKNTGEEVPIQQQVLIFHYLNGANGTRVVGEWIAYQEVPDGKFYLDAFLRRAKNPLVQAFGSHPERLLPVTQEVYGAKAFGEGDHSVVVQAFPLVPVVLILWEGDDEFPPEGNLLFDRSICDILSAEDIAWLAGMIIYPIMGMAG